MVLLGAPQAATTFLQQTNVADPSELFRQYAHYLLRSANAWQLPISLDQVRKQHGFQRKTGSLSQRGFLLGDTIFVNSDDLATVQRFTVAHEMMEALYIALKGEVPARFSPEIYQSFVDNKENLCEQGAAELLLPAELFFPLVKKQGIKFSVTSRLAQHCNTSFTATMRRMLEVNLEPCIFALLKEGHKKSEVVPSKTGQDVLWGNLSEWDPPAELRVWRYWRSPQVETYLCINESFSRDTSIYQTFQSGVAGKITIGQDALDLEYIKGQHATESMLVTINETSTVMVLIHL